MMPARPLINHWKSISLGILILLLLVFYLTDPRLFIDIYDWAVQQNQSYQLIIFLILLQIFLFSFALPGSFVLWLTAPLFHPLIATGILVIGATLGGCGAYGLSRLVGKSWYQSLQTHHVFIKLEQNSDFISIFALRLIPGLPQSLMNYSAGLLHIPLLRYAMASFLGLIPRTILYTVAIHEAVTAGRQGETPAWSSLIILLMLGMFVLLLRIWLLSRERTRQERENSMPVE